MKWRMASTSLTSGKSGDLAAHVLGAERRRRVNRRNVQVRQLIAHLARRALSNSSGSLRLTCVLAVLLIGHLPCSSRASLRNTSASESMSARRLISVAHSSTPLGSSGYQHSTGSPPTIFLLEQRLVEGLGIFHRRDKLVEERPGEAPRQLRRPGSAPWPGSAPPVRAAPVCRRPS